MKIDPIRTTATVIGSAMLGGVIGDLFVGGPVVYIAAVIGAVLGLILTLYGQRS